MLKARNILIVFALICLVGCRKNSPVPMNSQSGSVSGSTDESNVVRRLVAAVGPDHKSVRFDYQGTCDSEDTEIISLPAIKLGATAEDQDALARIQGLLGDNHQMSIIEQPKGIVHVKFGGVTSGILQTTIGPLSLDNDERHDPRAAINAIYRSEELKASIARLNTRHVYEMGHLIGHPVAQAAQVGPNIDGITVDQFIDNVLRAFPGVVVYKECMRPNGKRLFDITYYDH